MTTKLRQLQIRVAGWSQDNFGHQPSKFNASILGHLAPLLGLAEELGEYHDAINFAEEQDALADSVIYLCDFCTRLEIELDCDIVRTRPTPNNLVVHLGKIFHHVLKLHQGIRGYNDHAFALDLIEQDVLLYLSLLAGYSEECLITSATNTFDAIVSKRNWKEKPNG